MPVYLRFPTDFITPASTPNMDDGGNRWGITLVALRASSPPGTGGRSLVGHWGITLVALRAARPPGTGSLRDHSGNFEGGHAHLGSLGNHSGSFEGGHAHLVVGGLLGDHSGNFEGGHAHLGLGGITGRSLW